MSKKADKKEEIKDSKEEVLDQDQEATEAVEKEEEQEEVSDLEKAEQAAGEAKDKYLRLYSEFENFRRRTAKERLSLISTANEELMSALLPVMDDFERAQKALEESEDHKASKEGRIIGFDIDNGRFTSCPGTCDGGR